jgi:hypothetical protein
MNFTSGAFSSFGLALTELSLVGQVYTRSPMTLDRQVTAHRRLDPRIFRELPIEDEAVCVLLDHEYTLRFSSTELSRLRKFSSRGSMPTVRMCVS